MGNLMRQYWIPVVPTAQLSEPGGRPLRVRLLGEDLVLFRTTTGAVGLIGAFCPHRLAPLYFGRVEADGLRCAYHAWKYAPNGKCIEMPNIPEDQQFKDDSATSRLSLRRARRDHLDLYGSSERRARASRL